MSNLNKVVYLSNAHAQELFANGTITVNGITVTYSPDDLYVTPSGEVVDVRVNGSSIVSDNVADVPIMTTSRFGVAKAGGASLGINVSGTGVLTTKAATAQEIKLGTHGYNPITPQRQTDSVFYALAKLAGADMASSSNPVGTFTDEAKVAIQKMLGIYEAPWELIREDTFTNETEADHEITVDVNGEPFELTDVILILWVPSQDNIAKVGDCGRVYFKNDNTNIRCVYLNAISITAQSATRMAIARLTQNNGLMSVDYAEWNNESVHQNIRVTLNKGNDLIGTPFGLNNTPIDSILIRAITGTMWYRLLGKRKWD